MKFIKLNIYFFIPSEEALYSDKTNKTVENMSFDCKNLKFENKF